VLTLITGPVSSGFSVNNSRAGLFAALRKTSAMLKVLIIVLATNPMQRVEAVA
jgi:hypothetical protein